jgi:hypothetical protein
MWLYLGLGILALVAFLALRREGELFCVSVREGRVLVVRGRIPQGLLNDFADVVKQAKTARGTLRGLREVDRARLAVSGLDDLSEQRLRNIFQLYPLSKLSAVPPRTRRTVGQLLGIAWLAWLFERFRLRLR